MPDEEFVLVFVEGFHQNSFSDFFRLQLAQKLAEEFSIAIFAADG
jgi:hypothetical protein